MTFEAGHEEAAKLLRSEIDLADARPGVADSAEYLTAKSSYGGFLCHADQQGEGVRTVWDVLARVQSSHGASGLQLELPLTAMTSCMRSFADPSTVDFALQAFEAAAAREQPPSSNLMRRAEFRSTTRSIFASSIGPGISSNAPSKMARRFPKKSCENALFAASYRAMSPGWHSAARPRRPRCLPARRNRRRIPSTRTGCVSAKASPSGRTGTTQRRSRRRASFEETCPQVKHIGRTLALRMRERCAPRPSLMPAIWTAALASANEALEHQKEFMRFDPQAADLGIVVGRATSLLTVWRRRRSNPCGKPTASGLAMIPRASGQPKPSIGSVRPGSPTVKSSAAAGWWPRPSARWRRPS